MPISKDDIQYVPPEIKGHVPEEVMSVALEEIKFEDVWNVLIVQAIYTPHAEQQGYRVTTSYGKGGQQRDTNITA